MTKSLAVRLGILIAVVIVFIIMLQVALDTRKTEEESNNKETVEEDYQYRAIAYVTVPASENWRWIGTDGPSEDDAVSAVDTAYVTHINFAFGMLEAYQFESGKPGCPLKEGDIVSQEAYRNPEDGQYHYRATVQGWIEEMDTLVDGREYLRALVKLKEKAPDLNVLLSIGGWNSDGFCYMTKTKEGRAEFIESCIELVSEYNLDGIDVDWEFPTNGGWGELASCESCVEDGENLLKELRIALDEKFDSSHKLLSIASGASQPWVGEETFASLDYINVMCYDQNPGAGGSQAGLDMAEMGLDMHINMVGDTPENRRKLNLGIPFYNEGGPYLVPYYKGWNGHVDASPEITRKKMEWVIKNGYGGGFYWAYSMDTFAQDVQDKNSPEIKILQRTLYETLNGKVSGSETADITDTVKVPVQESPAADNIKKGSLTVAKIESKAIAENITDAKTEQSITVWLPPSYGESEKNYPVIYYLHGFAESARAFITGREEELNASFAAGNKEFLVVGINGANVLGGSFYVNSPITGNWEDYVIDEVIPFIDSNYRTIKDGSARGIFGFSMGGFGAINLAFKHPDVFVAVYSISPGLLADGDLPSAMATWKYDMSFKKAYAQAFSPDPENEWYGGVPQFDNTPEDDQIIKNWENGFGNINQKIDDYIALEKPLAGIKIVYGTSDEYDWIPRGCEFMSDCLSQRGIEHTLKASEGGRHTIPQGVVSDDIIPFFNEYLVFE